MAKRFSVRAHRLGCRLLDRDHEVLLRIMDRLQDAVEGRENRSLNGLMVALDAYFDAHLENEEELMRTWEYPQAAEHKLEHDGIRAQMRGMIDGIRAGQTEMAETAHGLLREWLCHHIAGTDRPLAQYLNRRGAARKLASERRKPSAQPELCPTP